MQPQPADPYESSDVSATVPDWSRETCKPLEWVPGRQVLRAIRDYQAALGLDTPAAVARRRAAALRHRFWSAVAACELPLMGHIQGGLMIPHPNGIVVHPEARIGPNCILFQQVTIGRGGKQPGAPVLVGHVDVGAGARILGGVTIGAHAKIGANAVVLCDVPAHATAVGAPARVLTR